MAENTTETVKKDLIGGPVGTFRHVLDGKKRLTIPSEWRDAMGNPEYLFVYPNMTQTCLNLVPPQEMQLLLDQMKKASLFDPEAEALREQFGEHVQMVKVDSAWRIRINDDLLGFAEIKGAVTMKGAVRNVKIWASEKLPPAPAAGQAIDVSGTRAAMAQFAALAKRAAEKGGLA